MNTKYPKWKEERCEHCMNGVPMAVGIFKTDAPPMHWFDDTKEAKRCTAPSTEDYIEELELMIAAVPDLPAREEDFESWDKRIKELEELNQRGEQCVGYLRDIAIERGWDGMNNSKVLHIFLEEYIKEQESKYEKEAVELREMRHTFDLRYKADMRAIQRWQIITRRELEWPGHEDLLLWLLAQLEKTKEAVGHFSVLAVERFDTISSMEHDMEELKAERDGVVRELQALKSKTEDDDSLK